MLYIYWKAEKQANASHESSIAFWVEIFLTCFWCGDHWFLVNVRIFWLIKLWFLFGVTCEGWLICYWHLIRPCVGVKFWHIIWTKLIRLILLFINCFLEFYLMIWHMMLWVMRIWVQYFISFHIVFLWNRANLRIIIIIVFIIFIIWIFFRYTVLITKHFCYLPFVYPNCKVLPPVRELFKCIHTINNRCLTPVFVWIYLRLFIYLLVDDWYDTSLKLIFKALTILCIVSIWWITTFIMI